MNGLLLEWGDLLGMNSKEEQKEIIKEALKEWLDEKFLTFGKWSFLSVAALFVAAVVYFILFAHGWKQN